MAYTKKEKNDFARNAVMENFSNELANSAQVDNNAFVFETVDMEGNVKFVEVKFVVKNDGYDVAEAVQAYADKVAAAAKRAAEAAANKKEKAK